MNDATLRVSQKQRLDTLLVDLGLAESREKARALIMAGSVLVEARVPRPSPGQTRAGPAGPGWLRAELPYVSRGSLDWRPRWMPSPWIRPG